MASNPRAISVAASDLLKIIAMLLALCCCTTLAHKTPRIAVCSMSIGVMTRNYLAQTVVNKAAYCTRQDYQFRLFHHMDGSSAYSAVSRSKFRALRAAIKDGEHDWLLWLDGDVVITNFGVRIESLLPRSQDIDFVVAKNCNITNMGAFLARASDSALEHLEEVFSGRHVDDVTLRDYWFEGKSFSALHASDGALRNRTLVASQKRFITYPDLPPCNAEAGSGWTRGDFAVHFPLTDENFHETQVPIYLSKVVN